MQTKEPKLGRPGSEATGSESVYLGSILVQCSTQHIQGTLHPEAKYLEERNVKLKYTFLLQFTHNLAMNNNSIIPATSSFTANDFTADPTDVKRKKTNLKPLIVACHFLIRDFACGLFIWVGKSIIHQLHKT